MATITLDELTPAALTRYQQINATDGYATILIWDCRRLPGCMGQMTEALVTADASVMLPSLGDDQLERVRRKIRDAGKGRGLC